LAKKEWQLEIICQAGHKSMKNSACKRQLL
jgi:hypothetical protein